MGRVPNPQFFFAIHRNVYVHQLVICHFLQGIWLIGNGLWRQQKRCWKQGQYDMLWSLEDERLVLIMLKNGGSKNGGSDLVTMGFVSILKWSNPWRIHGAGRKMLTWLGYIDGIHGAPYIAAPWILWSNDFRKPPSNRFKSGNSNCSEENLPGEMCESVPSSKGLKTGGLSWKQNGGWWRTKDGPRFWDWLSSGSIYSRSPFVGGTELYLTWSGDVI